MASSKIRKPVDDGPSIQLRCDPYVGHSVVTVVLRYRAGSSRADRRLAQWNVRLTRADLAGHSVDDVLLAVLGVVMRRLESGRTNPAKWDDDGRANPTAVGPGAPASGATGAVQYPLPGMPADSGTPGSVGTV